MATWGEFKNIMQPRESGGDYNALFSYANRPNGQFAGTNLTNMSIDQLLDFSNPSGPYAQFVKDKVGRVATPMGANQIVGTTLRDAKSALGLSGQEKFTPEMQDSIGEWIYKTQGPNAWASMTTKGRPDMEPLAQPTAATYDPIDNLSKSQRMMLAFGALRDAGTALTGGQGNAFATTLASVQDQQKIGAQMQQRAKLNEYIQGLTGPTTTPSAFVDPTKPLGAPLVSATELAGTPSVATQTAPVANRSALQSQIGKLTAAAQVAATIDPVAAAKLSVQASQLQAQLDNMPTSQNLTPDEVSELGLPIGTVAQRDISGKINVVSKPDKPSEAEAKTLTYEARAAGALPKVDKLELSLTGGWDKFLESGQGIPAIELATSYMQSEDYKRARNAGLEFVSAILRKDSGATITAEEEALANRQYLPVPNDSTSVLKDKREARHRALEALREGLPAAEIDKRAKAGFKTQAQDAAATPIPQGSGPIVINGYTIEAIE
jgi:hypothetical protein